MLRVEGLRVYLYPGWNGKGRPPEHPVKAVDGVDLEVQPGQIAALAGESGCGKTTLGLALGRLLPKAARQVEGKILLDGTDVTNADHRGLRKIRGRTLAYIFQDPLSALNPVMTLQEQLTEGLELREELSREDAHLKALELLEKVRMPWPEKRLRQYPHQLSGGMRQRAMIAMALAGEPKLLVADEPTTALDLSIQDQILGLIEELKNTLGMSVLLITHDLSVVAPHSDRMFVMYAGRLVEAGPTRQVLTAPAHPYTQALIRCLPPVGQGQGRLRPIAGSVPDLRSVPPGCPFHPRCPEAVARCREEEPQLKDYSAGVQVSCWQRSQAS
ncbi:MAG: ABC transporter ATP-binding protein [Candidatus Omnitrophica bacterium]|nr:ABC transporter ATP-binding protein [Candidatus Omnitrophota bacterium]